MARNIPINGNENDNKLEEKTEYQYYGNSDYLDFGYIGRLDNIGRFGLDFDKIEVEEDPLYNDLSEYVDKKDFINILHEIVNFELENPSTWNC